MSLWLTTLATAQLQLQEIDVTCDVVVYVSVLLACNQVVSTVHTPGAGYTHSPHNIICMHMYIVTRHTCESNSCELKLPLLELTA
jgi:hypothetical protein